MAKPIITLNGLKIVIMLGMLVIILCGIRFAAEIIVPFILALFIAVILNPLVQHMVRWRVPRVLAVSILMTIIVMAMVLLLAYLGSALNELTRTLPQYRNSIMTPLQAIEPLLQRVGIDVSVDQLAHYIDPNAAMTLLTNLLTQLSNAMSSIFLLLLTVLFMLLEVPQLPGKFQQMMARPVEGMAAIQRAIDSVSHYLVLKTAIFQRCHNFLFCHLAIWHNNRSVFNTFCSLDNYVLPALNLLIARVKKIHLSRLSKTNTNNNLHNNLRMSISK